LRRWYLLLFLVMFIYAEPKKEIITVGEPVVIESEKDLQFSPPFHLLSKMKQGSKYKYVITVFKPGLYSVKIGERFYQIEVESVLKGGEELSEIQPPLSVPGNPSWVLVRVGGFMLLIFLSFGTYYLLRRRKQREVTPEEELEFNLNLAKKKLAEDNLDSFYSILSFALRNFLQKRKRIPALSMTSSELESVEKSWIPYVIKRAELVRFAGMSVEKEGAEMDLDRALKFLEERKNEISAA